MKMKDRVYRIVVLSTVPIVFASAMAFTALRTDGRNSTSQKMKGAVGWELMKIDGNRSGRSVEFTHESHQQYMEKSGEGCSVCHHLSLPDDSSSSCYECHKDMSGESSIFDHELHSRIYRGKGTHCNECHGKDRSRERAKKCAECHPDYTESTASYLKVRGYDSAMHGSCIACHRKQDEKLGQRMYTECSFCHPDAE